MCIKFKIPVTLIELRLDLTLQSGQSFRWFKIESNRWRGVLENDVWTLYQDEKYLYCDIQKGEKSKDKITIPDLESRIRKYFRLDECLSELYNKWSSRDPFFKKVCDDFSGIRILDQDPVENVFSFICSSNNNIERITKLVSHLCEQFGSHVATVDQQNWFSFPLVQKLSVVGTEEKLRSLAFGYRAKYIYTSAKMVEDKGGATWLHNLRELPYETCHSEILQLSGVGPKVADCICLMSMNKLEAIPVDTHVFQIAVRNYLPHLREKKSLSSSVYKEIADHFRDLFGPYAGWAHSVLFTADLRKFKDLKVKCEEKKTKKRRRTEK